MSSWLADNTWSIPKASNAEVPSPCNISPGDNSKKAIINPIRKHYSMTATYFHNNITTCSYKIQIISVIQKTCTSTFLQLTQFYSDIADINIPIKAEPYIIFKQSTVSCEE